MSKKDKRTSKKVPVLIPDLPEPWQAIQHTGRENRIYFYNKETKEALWQEEFETEYGHLVGMKAKPTASSRNQLKTNNLKRIKTEKLNEQKRRCEPKTKIEEGEPMDVDIEMCNMELREFRSHNRNSSAESSFGFLPLNVALEEIHLDRVRSSIAVVFDTSVLIHQKNILHLTAEAGIVIRIPFTALRELDGLQKVERLRSVVTAVLRDMEELRQRNPDFISFESLADMTATFRQTSSTGEETEISSTTPDEYIIKTALSLKVHAARCSNCNVVLVTNDRNMRIKAVANGMNVMSGEQFNTAHLAGGSNSRMPSENNMGKDSALSCVPRVSRIVSTQNLPVQSKRSRGDMRKQSPLTMKAWFFQTESKKFMYIFTAAAEHSMEIMRNETECDIKRKNVKEAMEALGHKCFHFIHSAFGTIPFREAVKATETLYDISVSEMTSNQRVRMNMLETEVVSGGHDGECIRSIFESMQKYIGLLQENGWKPT